MIWYVFYLYSILYIDYIILRRRISDVNLHCRKLFNGLPGITGFMRE